MASVYQHLQSTFQDAPYRIFGMNFYKQYGDDLILEDVWELAASARLSVKSIKSEKPVPAAGYMEQPLKISMEGRFEGFYRFLLALESLPRITRIHQLKLERKTKGRSDDEDPSGVMKADFVLSIYFESPADTD